MYNLKPQEAYNLKFLNHVRISLDVRLPTTTTLTTAGLLLHGPQNPLHNQRPKLKTTRTLEILKITRSMITDRTSNTTIKITTKTTIKVTVGITVGMTILMAIAIVVTLLDSLQI
jgi:hypothetical protein